MRTVGDFNIKTGESSAVRLGAMVNKADNNGAGSSLDKMGVAGTFRTGIGEADEFSVSLYHLDNNNGMNYGMPWIRPSAGASVAATTLLPIAPESYYGLASDRNKGTATQFTVSHTHRFSSDTELVSKIRSGDYTRDQRAGTVRLAAAALQPGGVAATLDNFGASTVLTRGTQLKIQDMQTLHAQSDLSLRLLPGRDPTMNMARGRDAGILRCLHRHGRATARFHMQAAQDAGISTACHIHGGIAAWKKAEGPISA